MSAMFPAKRGIARAVGSLSRRSGRGGGTTLPGRLLVRRAPDAIARLADRLERGSIVVSSTNGKTTTAGMISGILRADGRTPVHNRAGSNMHWGVATALVERLEGSCEFALNADDPLIADLGRDRDLRRRPGVTYFGIEDQSQALPELQHAHDAKHCRRCGAPYVYDRAFVGHLGHYTCPNCDADRPAPDVAATKIELHGISGSRVHITTPQGDLSLDLPLPGLYNVYNALAAVTAGLRAGVGLEQVRR